MKVKIGIVGYFFARDFARLFSLHPDVEKVCIADLSPEKRAQAREDFPDGEIYESYDEMLEKSDINCVGIFTQRHLHGPMIIQALKAGKHVYSAVPIGCTIEEIKEIIELVKETRLIYMMGKPVITIQVRFSAVRNIKRASLANSFMQKHSIIMIFVRCMQIFREAAGRSGDGLPVFHQCFIRPIRFL